MWWTEIWQDAETDKTNAAIDSPRADEDARKNRREETELNPGNCTPGERDADSIGPGNNDNPTDTVYEAPVISTINKQVIVRMGPPAHEASHEKCQTHLENTKASRARFASKDGLDIIRMYGILELAKRKVSLQRLLPEGHAQAYREMMRQACDAANREAKRRKKEANSRRRTGTVGIDTTEITAS